MPAHAPTARAQWPSLHDLTISPWTQDQRARDPARRLLFLLGTHRPWWLAHSPVPLMVSAHTLGGYDPDGEGLPIAGCLYAIDSGAFTEIRDHGTWRIGEDDYGGLVYRLMTDCGYPEFAAPLDWPCEPQVLARTGATVRDHQEWTLDSYRYLIREFPAAPWLPVLQGWSLSDYEAHDAMYRKAGIDLAKQRLVGLGSVCRRGSIREIGAIAETFARRGYQLHGFGLKVSALREFGPYFSSADSLAWSQQARVTNLRLPGCRHGGRCCNNCPRWALMWREDVIAAIRASQNYTPAVV